jgi:hypothetical protein
MRFFRQKHFWIFLFWACTQLTNFSFLAHAGCIDDLHNQNPLTATDMYKLLLRSSGSEIETVKLFELASQDDQARAYLNDGIEKSPELKKDGVIGLQYKKDLKNFLANQFSTDPLPLARLLFPKQDLYQQFFDFKNNGKNTAVLPPRPNEVAMKARVETARHFNLATDFSNQEFGRPEVKRYYQQLENRFSLIDDVRQIKKPALTPEAFQYWAQNQLAIVKQRRAENLLRAIAVIPQLGETPLRMYLSRMKAKEGQSESGHFTDLFTKLTLSEDDLRATKPEILAGPDSHALTLVISQDQPIAPRGSPEWWRRKTANYVSLKGNFLYAYETNEFLSFEFVSEQFKSTVDEIIQYLPWLKGRRPNAYQISMKEILRTLRNYAKKINKTDIERTNFLQDELFIRVTYEEHLRKLESLLEGAAHSKNVAQFETSIQSQIKNEEEARPSSLFNLARSLLQPVNEDALTGVEWAGYRQNYKYWWSRDYWGTHSSKVKLENGAKPSTDLSSYRTQESKRTALAKAWSHASAQATVLKTNVMAGIISASVMGGVVVGAVAVTGNFSELSGTHFSNHRGSQISMTPDMSAKDDDDHQLPQPVFDVTVNFTPHDTLRSVPPTLFREPTVSDVEDTEHRMDITQSMMAAQPDTLNTVPGSLQKIDYVSLVDVKDWQGYVMVPKPLHYHLTHVFLSTSGNAVNTNAISKVYFNRQTEEYYIQVKDESRGHALFLTANFKENPEELADKMLSETLDDPRFHQLDRAKLAQISTQLRVDGIMHVGQKLDQLIADTAHDISIQDIQDLIADNEVYSLKPGTNGSWFDAWSSDPFRQDIQHLRNGVEYFKCDAAAQLQLHILQKYFEDQPDVVIEMFHSDIFESQSLSVSQGEDHGVISSIGHAQVRIHLKNKWGALVLDATPTHLENGTIISKVAHYSLGDRYRDLMNEEKQDAANRKAMLEKERRESSAPRPLQEAIPENTSASEMPVEESEVPDVKIDVVGAGNRHDEMVKLLNRQADDLESIAAFRQVVVAGRGGMPLPPQRIYILARGVSRFAGQEISLDQLVTKIHHLYPGVEFETPDTKEKITQMLKVTTEDDVQVWRTLYEKAKNSRVRTSYGWALDDFMKKLSMDVVSTLRQYHWVDTRKLN